MDESGIEAIPPQPQLPAVIAADFKPAKVRRFYQRRKYVKVITLHEGRGEMKRKVEIPATIDAAKTMAVITAEKLRQRIEKQLNDLEDRDAQATPKEYKDMAEALAKCDEIINAAMNANTGGKKPTPQNLTITGNVISGGALPASEDVSGLLAAVASAATKKSEEKPVLDIKANEAK